MSDQHAWKALGSSVILHTAAALLCVQITRQLPVWLQYAQLPVVRPTDSQWTWLAVPTPSPAIPAALRAARETTPPELPPASPSSNARSLGLDRVTELQHGMDNLPATVLARTVAEPAPERHSTAADLPNGLTAAAILSSAAGVAAHLPALPDTARVHSTESLPDRSLQDARTQATEHSATWLREHVREQDDHRGTTGYFWSLRRRLQEVWNPVPPATPDAVNSTVSQVIATPREAVDSLTNATNGSNRRVASAGDALDHAHPSASGVDEMGLQTARPTMAGLAERTARYARVILTVEQTEDGTIRTLTITRSSGTTGFDQEALRAIQVAVQALGHRPTHGARRSRWLFEVRVTRDPLVLPVREQSRSGASNLNLLPHIGLDFDESTGQLEGRAPGMVHVNHRVRLLGDEALSD